MLAQGGNLGFICADRWIKNRYGWPLRSLIAKQFHLGIYVDMVDTPAFYADVIAYPAIISSAGKRLVRHALPLPAIDRTILGPSPYAFIANPA